MRRGGGNSLACGEDFHITPGYYIYGMKTTNGRTKYQLGVVPYKEGEFTPPTVEKSFNELYELRKRIIRRTGDKKIPTLSKTPVVMLFTKTLCKIRLKQIQAFMKYVCSHHLKNDTGMLGRLARETKVAVAEKDEDEAKVVKMMREGGVTERYARMVVAAGRELARERAREARMKKVNAALDRGDRREAEESAEDAQ